MLLFHIYAGSYGDNGQEYRYLLKRSLLDKQNDGITSLLSVTSEKGAYCVE
ncbi:hypothetical protein LJR153_006331 [Paenibacillus sp. LjRoot153]